MKLLQLKKPFNQNVISSRLKSFGHSGSLQLHSYFQDLSHRFLKKSRRRSITLDVDSTVLSVCGNQEGAVKGFNTKKRGAPSYHNLLAYVSELRIVINSWFRTGSAYTSNGTCEFLKEIEARLPSSIEKVFFRADSGFFTEELFLLLEKWNWDYLVKVKLKGLKALLEKQKWSLSKDGNEYTTFTHTCGTWKKSRIFYGVRKLDGYKEENRDGVTMMIPLYTYSCFCTNREATAKKVYKCYKERSTSETWIEEVKEQALAGKTLTNNFYANEILWIVNLMAYNIAVMARRKSRRHKTAEHKTFRDIFILVPGKVINCAGTIYLKIYKEYYFKKDWWHLEKSLT